MKSKSEPSVGSEWRDAHPGVKKYTVVSLHLGLYGFSVIAREDGPNADEHVIALRDFYVRFRECR